MSTRLKLLAPAVLLALLLAVLSLVCLGQSAYADESSSADQVGNAYTLFNEDTDLHSASITGIPTTAYYTGKQIKPVPVVKMNGKTLKEGTDYEVDYGENIGPGEGVGELQIWGMGSYDPGPVYCYFDIVRKPCNVKNLWASKHTVGAVLFKWTKESAFQATGWKVYYRTKKIGSGSWSGWKSKKDFKASEMEFNCSVPSNYVVEIHAMEKSDKTYSQGIITTPAGGKYQAMKTVYVKNVATGKRVDSITIKKGKTVKLRPDYEYPVANYKKRPRLYPNAALWDLTDQGKTIVSITKSDGSAYTGGMTDGVATFKGEKVGTTNMICRAPNGRTKVIKVTVTN